MRKTVLSVAFVLTIVAMFVCETRWKALHADTTAATDTLYTTSEYLVTDDDSKLTFTDSPNYSFGNGDGAYVVIKPSEDKPKTNDNWTWEQFYDTIEINKEMVEVVSVTQDEKSMVIKLRKRETK